MTIQILSKEEVGALVLQSLSLDLTVADIMILEGSRSILSRIPYLFMHITSLLLCMKVGVLLCNSG